MKRTKDVRKFIIYSFSSGRLHSCELTDGKPVLLFVDFFALAKQASPETKCAEDARPPPLAILLRKLAEQLHMQNGNCSSS
jgi:hypothetical protein